MVVHVGGPLQLRVDGVPVVVDHVVVVADDALAVGVVDPGVEVSTAGPLY